MVGWLDGWMGGWLDGCMVGRWPDCWMVKIVGWLHIIGFLDGFFCWDVV
jgi:hypothetical protein